MSSLALNGDLSSHDYMKKDYLQALQLARLQKKIIG